jgi:hypothetical protein
MALWQVDRESYTTIKYRVKTGSEPFIDYLINSSRRFRRDACASGTSRAIHKRSQRGARFHLTVVVLDGYVFDYRPPC